MKDQKISLSDLDDKPVDYRRALLASLVAQGLSEGEAWGKLPEQALSNTGASRDSTAAASRDKGNAEEKRWLVTRFAEELFEEPLLDKIREDTAHHSGMENDLEKELRELSGEVLKSVWVFNAGKKGDPGKDQAEWDWQIGNLARNSDWLIQKLLLQSQTGIAVGWGKTIAESIAAVADRFKRGRGETTGASGREPILVIPTIGTPPDSSVSDSDREHSSTRLAKNTSEAINGTSNGCESLDNTPIVMLRELGNKDQIRDYLMAVGGGFARIFGRPDHPEGQKPLIQVVDTVLTSAGEFHNKNESFFLKQLLQTGRVSMTELIKLSAGDLGSALIPKQEIEGNPALKKRFDEIRDLLLFGIRLSHYQDVALRAAAHGKDGPAGVILLALNRNKANIVFNCVRHQAVSVLVIDYDLAVSLKGLLADERKTQTGGHAAAKVPLKL